MPLEVADWLTPVMRTLDQIRSESTGEGVKEIKIDQLRQHLEGRL